MALLQTILILALCVGVMISFIFVASFIYIFLTNPQRQVRRSNILKELQFFAATNLVVEIGKKQIDHFYSSTADTNKLFYNSSISRVRVEMYENAMKLYELREKQRNLSSNNQPTGRSSAMNETLWWFGKTKKKLDSLVSSENLRQSSFKTALNDSLSFLCRAIRV